MFLRREDYERLVRLAAQAEFLQNALASAEQRAEDAEKALASERGNKDWLTLQLASRVVTKHGQYGLDHEAPKPVEPIPVPQGFTHNPTELDYAKLDFYKKCYRDAGMDEEKAEERWNAEMRGEFVPLESESEVEQ